MMWRYALLGSVIVGGVIALAALDMSLWSPPQEPPRPPPPPKVAPSPLPPLSPLPALPPYSIVPPPLPEYPSSPLAPLPEAVVPPAPIPVPAAPEPPRKPVARPKPPAPTAPPITLSPPPQAPPVEPPTTARNDLLLVRRTIRTGQLADARELLSRIQTRLVFRPVTPDQPERNDPNAAATALGRAIRALDNGDREAAIQIIDNVLSQTPE